MATLQATSADFSGDRRPALYGTLVTFIILNNLAVAARLVAHYVAYYRKGRHIFVEDVFVILSGVRGNLQIADTRLTVFKACVNVVIGNLLACTVVSLLRKSHILI